MAEYSISTLWPDGHGGHDGGVGGVGIERCVDNGILFSLMRI